MDNKQKATSVILEVQNIKATIKIASIGGNKNG